MDERISVQITESFSSYIDTQRIRDAVEETLSYFDVSQQVFLTVVFETDETLHQLNHQYLGIDAPTDVLSFPADHSDPDTGHRYLGDILISVPRALEQAAMGNHPLEEELQLLVVHAALHLLGFDHGENKEKEEMQAAQSAILHRLGSELKVDL
jgi:probable rRNA maturation factor